MTTGASRLAELVEPRRKAFAKLDLNQDGKLGFEEWAVKTIDKFEDADDDEQCVAHPRRICRHRAQAQGQEGGVRVRLSRAGAGMLASA